jgi:hypothetical protein
MSYSLLTKRTSLARLVVALVSVLALELAPSAAPASTPLLDLGPVVVANGTAALQGTVGSEAAGSTLTVNGQPVAVDQAGTFATAVNLNGASSIDLTLSGVQGGQTVSYQVPLTGALLGPGGVIPAGVVDTVQQAGVSLVTPIAGTDALPVTVQGSVLDGSKLSGLSVNGTDALGRLTKDGSFTVQVPGTSTSVTVLATDHESVSESRTVHITRQASVSAANASGVRIVKVRAFTQNAIRLHQVRLVVTVKDRLGRLIRGARVSISLTRAGFLAKRPKATSTGRAGKATVVLRLQKGALGRRLVVLTVAKTPKAKARKLSGIRLPHAGR